MIVYAKTNVVIKIIIENIKVSNLVYAVRSPYPTVPAYFLIFKIFFNNFLKNCFLGEKVLYNLYNIYLYYFLNIFIIIT